MNDLQAAWLAGLFDGDGHVTMFLRNSGSTWPRFQMGITNTNIEALYYIQELTGVGQVYIRKQARHGKQRLEGDYYISSMGTGLWLLQQIEPFCVLKREQVQLTIEFLQTKDKERRIELMYKVKELKKVEYEANQEAV